MSDFGETYSREAALGFPLVPSEHNRAWRYMFDWAVAGDALNCSPGDLVLEFGAGPGFASELFNRLGYRTVAFDVDATVLGFARERWDADSRLARRRAHFVAGDGMRLPFADAAFDGIICLNALHHMPDYEATLAEMRRVLKPGARVAFSEPGRLHDQTEESKLAIERGAVERSVMLEDIDRLARRVGFARIILKPYVYPYLVELAYEEFQRYRLHLGDTPFTQPDQIARFFVDYHPLFVLEVPGRRPATSASVRGHGALTAAIRIEGLPTAVQPLDELSVRAEVSNTGHATWLHAPREFGGHVALGMKLCTADGRVLQDNLIRTPLPRDIAPGERFEAADRFVVPWLPPGTYRLKFDLVSEQLAWFEYFGSPTVVHVCEVLERIATNRHPRSLRSEVDVDGLPAHTRAGANLVARVTARNSGDSRWLSSVDPMGGFVTVGTKLFDPAGRLVSDTLGRTPLPHDIDPGGQVTVECVIPLPPSLAPGAHVVRFDVVNEPIAWFEQYGSVVVDRTVIIDALRSEVDVDGLPTHARAGANLVARVTVRNSGDSRWLSSVDPLGGFVTVGTKLFDPAGRLVSDTLGRTPLPHDIDPGEEVTVECVIPLPPSLAPGAHVVRFDVVNEPTAWFEQYGSAVVDRTVIIDALRSEVDVDGVPTHARAGTNLVARVTARNSGDSRWLSSVDPTGGFVTVGTKLFDPAGRLISDALGRTLLPHDIDPGGQVTVECVIPLPPSLAPGPHVVRFDVVNERIAWFEQYGSAVADCTVIIDA